MSAKAQKRYGFDSSNTDPVRMQFPLAASVDNVELEQCAYCSSKDGNNPSGVEWEAVDIVFKRTSPEGVSLLRDREFCINEANIQVSTMIPNDTIKDAQDRAYKRFNGKLKLVANCLGISEVELMASCADCNTPKEFVDAYCNLVNTKGKGKKIYVKTVLDKSGYTKLAKFAPSNPMCQSMTGPSSLRYTPKEKDFISKYQNSEPKGIVAASDEDQWG
jgi:hypothetical protein